MSFNGAPMSADVAPSRLKLVQDLLEVQNQARKRPVSFQSCLAMIPRSNPDPSLVNYIIRFNPWFPFLAPAFSFLGGGAQLGAISVGGASTTLHYKTENSRWPRPLTPTHPYPSIPHTLLILYPKQAHALCFAPL